MGAATPKPSAAEQQLQQEQIQAQDRLKAQNKRIQTNRLQSLKQSQGPQTGSGSGIPASAGLPANSLFTAIQNVGTSSQAAQQFSGTTSTQKLGATKTLGG